MEVSSKQSLVEKYIEFKQLMLKIDPAEEDEEERLASAMRTYQVPESPVPSEVAIGVPVFGAAPVLVSAAPIMGAPTTPMKAPRSSKSAKTPRSPRAEKSSSKKKSHKKRKRKIESDESSDDSDCDPDFRA